MGDPLSVAASGLAIATATVQTTKFLYQTVQSFTSHQSTVEQLARELADLSKVLVSLCDHIKDDEQPFLPLKSPLLQCRQACANYAKFLEKCNKHSKNGRTSLRDVGRLNFMSSDMANFTSMLASYRSTINITMADANLYVTPPLSGNANGMDLSNVLHLDVTPKLRCRC